MPFDRDRFIHDVKRARSEPKYFAPRDDDHELAFVLEASSKSAQSAGDLRGQAGEVLGIGGGDLLAEPVFAGDEDLRRFVLLRVPEVPLRAMTQSVFEVGHHLTDSMQLLSTEPDLPTGTPVIDDPDGGFCAEPESDASDDLAWALRAMRVDAAWRWLDQHAAGRARGEGVAIGHPDTGWAEHDDFEPGQENIDVARGHDFILDIPGGRDPLDYWVQPNRPGHGLATGSVIVSKGGIDRPPGYGYGGTTGPGSITGVASGATLVPLRAIKSVMRFSQWRVARAVHRATDLRCGVISMSLGGVPSRALRAAVDRAIQRGLIVLAAAGNCWPWVVWPARYRQVIAVAATNRRDRPWRFSARGPRVDLSAPGENVWRARRWSSAAPRNEVAPGQGTSFAVAHLAGIAALWLARHGGTDSLWKAHYPQATPQALFRAAAVATARRPAAWDRKRYGAGIVDAERLVSGALGPATVEPSRPAPDDDREVAREVLGEWPWFEGAGARREQLLEDGPGLARHGLELAYHLLGSGAQGRSFRASPERWFARKDERGGDSALGVSDSLRAWLGLE